MLEVRESLLYFNYLSLFSSIFQLLFNCNLFVNENFNVFINFNSINFN